jgi:hypothetical protein
MEIVERTSKLLVVVDKSGEIVAALWPGLQSADAPPQTGVALSEGQVAHEVDLPSEFYQEALPDIAAYRLDVDEYGNAALVTKNP